MSQGDDRTYEEIFGGGSETPEPLDTFLDHHKSFGSIPDNGQMVWDFQECWTDLGCTALWDYLANGWEPFGASEGRTSSRVFLRKLVTFKEFKQKHQWRHDYANRPKG